MLEAAAVGGAIAAGVPLLRGHAMMADKEPVGVELVLNVEEDRVVSSAPLRKSGEAAEGEWCASVGVGGGRNSCGPAPQHARVTPPTGEDPTVVGAVL